MKCPFCAHLSTEVVETRDSDDMSVTRRRRSCLGCNKRFTTYERVESVPLVILKKDGSKQYFDREKLRLGMSKATEKTKVTFDDINKIVDEVDRELRTFESAEIESKKIGELVALKLKQIDKVAYIRFASVFKRFVDVEEFERELKKLV